MDSEPDVHTNSHFVVSAAATDIVALAANFNFFVLNNIALLLYSSFYHSHFNMYMDFTYIF